MRRLTLTGNIVEFRQDKKKEDEQPPEKGNVLVSMTIRDDGSLSVWVSHAVQSDIEIDWIKEMAFNAVFTLGQQLEELDDRYVEHTMEERDLDDLND